MISGSVTTLNEERYIAECIRSLNKVCDEVYVVDSFSTDRTVEIAESLGAKIILHEYLGDGPQKNISLQHVRNDWILSLDADERLDDEAVESLRTLDTETARHTSYGFCKKNYIGDRWVRCAGFYPQIRGRLYNKRKTRWNNWKGHTRLATEDVGLLPGHILHYAYRDYHEYVTKIFKYSNRGAGILFEAGKTATPLTPIVHGMYSFIKHYLLQRGFMGGLDGLTLSLIYSVGSFVKYARLLELQRNNGHGRRTLGAERPGAPIKGGISDAGQRRPVPTGPRQ